MDVEKILLYGQQKADCYRLLSACFYQPRKRLFEEEHVYENFYKCMKNICPDASIFVKQMSDSFSLYNEEELASEFSALFVGPFELAAPPYGSVYLENNRRVIGDTSLEVLDIYQNAGLIIEDCINEPPDHIAIELEFMSYLTLKIKETYRRGNIDKFNGYHKLRNIFFFEYLEKWIYEFCKDIKGSTDNSYFYALADCLEAFVRYDADISDAVAQAFLKP